MRKRVFFQLYFDNITKGQRRPGPYDVKKLYQAGSQLDNWVGAHIHSCSAQLVSFEIDCFYGLRKRIYEYVPPPPNYRASYGPDLCTRAQALVAHIITQKSTFLAGIYF